MAARYIDLHLHTTASDGSFTPEILIKKAKKIGFSAISITDHDTVDGLKEGFKIANRMEIELVPGIEMNTDYKDTEVHILGYYINYEDQLFLDKLVKLKEARYNRIKKMAKKLNSLGVKINFDEIVKLAQGGSLGRPHVAQIMVDNGYVNDWNEAFEKYIGRHASAYVERKKLTPKEAIQLIKEADGIPVIAHPILIRDDELLYQLVNWGVRGVEVYHTEHTKNDSERYLRFAKDNDLLITGGSDCHGPKRKGRILLGDVKVPYYFLEELKKARY